MKLLSAFCIGLLFSFGLIISGMINPAKVLGFLDVFGAWDASLAFVMGGAVLVTSIGYRLLGNQVKPLFASEFTRPTRTDIDTKILAGPALFGIGWGLVGLCPGPAFAAVSSSPKTVLAFFVAMMLGMYLARMPWLNSQLASNNSIRVGGQSHDKT
ncbi:YeeE/YedE family protein [Granulosicoccus sp.]|nr:DUF6691 family protein [Granulosicoccus sp.]MDB4224675.1 YeeE/YedE family protein [Granulosicoccus sp.]